MAAPKKTPTPGWTPKRSAVVRVTSWLLALVAVGALWAMLMPWAGLTRFDTAAPACVAGYASNGLTQAANLSPEQASGIPGCLSAWQSIKDQGHASVNPLDPTVFGLPKMKVTMGIPTMTLWLVVSALLGALALSVRSGLLLVPVALSMNLSQRAFGDHVYALQATLAQKSYGPLEAAGLTVDKVTDPMLGMVVHQYLFLGAMAAVIGGGFMVITTNAKQRRADQDAYQRGELAKPPGMMLARVIESTLMRGALDKVADVATAAAAASKKTS